jgi:SAM-dependent methyltransferase
MPQMTKRGNYGLDSPGIVATLLVLALALLLLGNVVSRAWRWVAYFAGGYFLLGALGMLFYSKVGKLKLAQRLLDKISWRGDERVLDVGCGRGLLTVAAAHRVPKGSVTGVDVWNRAALSGNRSESVLENAKIERVEDRVEVKQGDAQDLPFPDGSFDVVISNFVVHEMKDRSAREKMMREIARVLRPGGHVALVDFIFTDDCVKDLSSSGVESRGVRDGLLSFWVSAILNFGAVKTYHVVGKKG